MKKIYNNGIDCKYFEENTQPSGWVPGQCKINYKLIFNLNEVLDYYTNHSTQDTAEHFECRKEKLIRFLQENNISIHSRAEDVQFANKKRKDTCLELYGVTNVNKLEIVREKVANTNLEKYGSKTYFQTDEFIQYNKTIQNDRYGGIGNASKIIGDKIRKTTRARYNVDYVFQLKEFVENNMRLQKEKYGGVGFASKELSEKVIATALRNNNLKSKEDLNKLIKTRQEETTLKRYGVRNYAQSPEFFKRLKKKYVYNSTSFDTIPELALFIYFIDNGIAISRNTDLYFEFIYKDKLHRYYPDFVSNDSLLEVKGNHFFKKDGTMCNPYDHSQDGLYEAKHQCGLQNNVIFITSNEYNKYIDYCKNKYNQKDWYINFKIKKEGDADAKNG